MPDLPRGTVTFLFTDIEGSTGQWERDPTTTRVVVDRQLAIIHQAVEAHGGIHFKTVGDGTQSAFFTAPQGVAAALDAQRGLIQETWPNLAYRPRVRMALHAGAAEPSDGDYLAGCLNRLARLLESAHGEQILLSHTVAELASDGLPEDASLEALGTFRLRDILQPEEIFQLRHPDLRATFPPLKSPEQLPHNLPVHPTPFLGRAREVEEAVTLLLLPSVRLVTLTGTGGVGKTRLGLQVAAEALESFPDGVFLIDLARLNDPDLVPSATATTLGLQEQQGKPLLETLADYLRERQILLLFDNFEHVLPAATFLADLLVAAPNLKVMVTSRSRLGLQAEHEYQVETLPVPDLRALPSLGELAAYDAIDLFVKRAQALRPNFSLTEKNARAVAEIVCRLEGLPLAIELAAAWVKILSPEALRDRLDRRLATLVGGARDLPARQRTLRDTIAWSHDLLPSEDQILFRRLSVFVGGWSLEGMEAVAAAACNTTAIDAVETLSRLIDQSLVETRQASDEAELRYIMLESIREFAREQLDASNEATQVRAAFERFLIDLAAKAEDGMRGPEQIHWLDRLEEEHNNIRAALRNAVDRGDGEVALNLAPRLWEFWRIRGYLVEGSTWLKQALDLTPANAPELRAAGEFALGKLSIDLANYEAAEAHFRNSAGLWQARGDRRRVVDAKNALVIVKLNTEEFEEGRALGEDALCIARLIGDELGSATALFNLGLIARSDDRLNEAVELLDEALSVWRAKGNPKWIALTTQSLGITHRRLGHVEQARAYLEESGEICKRLNNVYGLAVVASELGLIEEEIGHHDRAINFHLEAIKGFETVGAPLGIIESLEWIGVSAANAGLPIPALQLFGAADAARKTLRATPMSSEAPFINAGLETARQRAGARAEDAFRSGVRLTLEQAHQLAVSLVAEPVLKREGDLGRALP